MAKHHHRPPRKIGTYMNGNSTEEPPLVNLISLGCAKNTVDSERILGQFAQDGWLIASDPADADICLVNTCGFIADARAETREVLEELAELKAGTRLRAVAALGCMVERAAEVEDQGDVLEQADILIGFDHYNDMARICREYLGLKRITGGETDRQDFHIRPRLPTGYAHHAYLKISEGCSNRCSFCTIPAIRGPQRSVPVEALVAEARSLIGMGAREIEIIAQDSTSYGRDLYGEISLARLLRSLAGIEADVWFRLMYVFPPFLTDDILEVLAADPRFCPYIDIPLQHISDPILKAMGRGMGKAETLALLDRIEERIPGVALRSTFIAGYPGETEEQFLELLDFVRSGRFAHAGVFAYSRERNTRAAREDDNLTPEQKRERCDALMEAQREVSRQRLQKFVGQSETVMIDRIPDPDQNEGVQAIGHTRRQEIDVDGSVMIVDQQALSAGPGEVVPVKVIEACDYDLIAVSETA